MRFFIIFVFFAHHLFSQLDISTFVKLDTIIPSGIKIDYADIYPNDIEMKIYKNDLWLFYPSWTEDDTLHLVKINLQNIKREEVKLYLPSISFKTPIPNVRSFDVNDSALVLMFTNHSFAYFTLKKSKFVFSFMEPMAYSYNQFLLLDNGHILISNSYNSHPFDNPDHVSLNLYDCKQKKWIKTLTPNFNSIQFSHFSPYHWVSVANKKIILSQTVNYSATCYDFNLNKINDYAFHDKSWVYADSIYIKGLASVKPRINAKDLIDRLSPMEDSVSRIEAVYWIGKEKLLVRKIPANNKINKRQRFYDILILNKSNEWIKVHENITDKKTDADEICAKNNFPIQSVYDKNSFSDKYFVKLSTRFYNYEFGKTYSELKKKEDEAIGKKIPELFIEIFKANFDAK